VEESQLCSKTRAERNERKAAEEQVQQASNKPIAVDIGKVWARADAWREKRKAEQAVDTMFREMKGMTLADVPKGKMARVLLSVYAFIRFGLGRGSRVVVVLIRDSSYQVGRCPEAPTSTQDGRG
jgi:hypothetical protein